MGDKPVENTEQSTAASSKQYDQAAPPGPVASRARITACVLSIVLGLWMIFCSGLVFVDAFESFTDTRIVAAVVLFLALATVALGIVSLRHARDHGGGLRLSLLCILAAAVIASLLLYNAYGLLLLGPALVLALPSILLLLQDALKD
jgi:hypothetical protein